MCVTCNATRRTHVTMNTNTWNCIGYCHIASASSCNVYRACVCACDRKIRTQFLPNLHNHKQVKKCKGFLWHCWRRILKLERVDANMPTVAILLQMYEGQGSLEHSQVRPGSGTITACHVILLSNLRTMQGRWALKNRWSVVTSIILLSVSNMIFIYRVSPLCRCWTHDGKIVVVEVGFGGTCLSEIVGQVDREGIVSHSRSWYGLAVTTSNFKLSMYSSCKLLRILGACETLMLGVSPWPLR